MPGTPRVLDRIRVGTRVRLRTGVRDRIGVRMTRLVRIAMGHCHHALLLSRLPIKAVRGQQCMCLSESNPCSAGSEKACKEQWDFCRSLDRE